MWACSGALRGPNATPGAAALPRGPSPSPSGPRRGAGTGRLRRGCQPGTTPGQVAASRGVDSGTTGRTARGRGRAVGPVARSPGVIGSAGGLSVRPLPTGPARPGVPGCRVAGVAQRVQQGAACPSPLQARPHTYRPQAPGRRSDHGPSNLDARTLPGLRATPDGVATFLENVSVAGTPPVVVVSALRQAAAPEGGPAG
jgi:hypothetical protein